MQVVTSAAGKLVVSGREAISTPSSLEQLINNGSAPAIYRLSRDLFQSLEQINAKKCWFTDVCEKKILCTRDDRFSLSISGNTASQGELPDTATYACQEYWMPTFSYLIGRVRLTELSPGELPGILFSYLQTMLLILRVRLVFIDQEGYYNSASLFDQLPTILDKLIPEFRILFTRLLTKEDKTPKASDLKQIKSLFIRRVVLPPENADLIPDDLTTPPALHRKATPSRTLVSWQRPPALMIRQSTGNIQNGDLLVAIILAMALTFSAWLWLGH
ncbi:MAG: hypothetical protein JST42_15230 [Bacteroidetes bacterium]|nr:hypothetical protein [Bacteroidota bacterium]